MSYTKPKNTTTAKPLTNEEKAAQVARFLAQKRESFALAAFAGICRADGMQRRPTEVAAWAMDAADALLERLYPVTKDTDEK